jgi:Domain of unknown function (DUF4383)
MSCHTPCGQMYARPRLTGALLGRSYDPRQGASLAHATSASSSRTAIRDHARTPAQLYCLLAGLALLLAGVFGFISDSSFDTGSNVQGGTFLGFEVNAIHNLIHVASGLVLLGLPPSVSRQRLSRSASALCAAWLR